jgi:2-dehydro-3-deoxyphosphooctonate aldolase (KDO 8-P synthase)
MLALISANDENFKSDERLDCARQQDIPVLSVMPDSSFPGTEPPPLSIGSQEGGVRLGGALPLFILGPCVIESEEFVWSMARRLKAICADQRVPFVFKASYDKANRTSGASFRGSGVEAGCRILGEISRELGVPVTTDVHSPGEAEKAAEWIDILQIPAFLCRQTDLIEAAARTGRVVNVKKGQFLAPQDVANIARKLDAFGCDRFFFTERGVTFGYNNLVADMRSLYWIRELGYRVVFDATHSVQRPGGGGDKTSGDGVLAPVLARAAVAAGCDGVFIETHEEPSKALSDGPNQVPLDQLPALLGKLIRLHALVRE